MRLRRIVAWIVAGVLFGACAAAHAERFEGIVTHVTDGDTLWVRSAAGGAPMPIRLDGIDAPEICQAYGVQAREALAQRVLQRHVVVTSRASDTYYRKLGRVHVEGDDVGGWMVSQGHAWSYRFRRDRGPYGPQEAQARSAQLGLWSGAHRETPRNFRRRHGSCK